MDKARYRAIKLIFEILVGVLGLIVGGGGLYFMYQINTNVSATSDAVSKAASDALAISEIKSSIKADAKVEVSPSISLGEGKDAKVSGEFKSAIQACWYYQAHYKSLHPYTVLWEQSGNTDYPKIRVVAERGIWNAHRCIKDKEVVKLIGDEYITHKIEAQFAENDEYEHIATSKAKYYSALLFDEKGRISQRRIKEAAYKCIPPEGFTVKDCKDKAEVTQNKENNNNSLKYENIIIITELKNEKEKQEKFGSEKYSEAIELYLRKRETLHKNLVEQGCGAVPIEPEFTNKGGNLEKPSIVFLCHKNDDKSHVRVMVRKESEFDQDVIDYNKWFR